jgi:hypothetical protein
LPIVHKGGTVVDPLAQFQEDIVADVFQSIHLQSALYCRAHLSAPWGLGIPRREVATFHIDMAGSCWLKVEGTHEPVFLTAGDLLILPHGMPMGWRTSPPPR